MLRNLIRAVICTAGAMFLCDQAVYYMSRFVAGKPYTAYPYRFESGFPGHLKKVDPRTERPPAGTPTVLLPRMVFRKMDDVDQVVTFIEVKPDRWVRWFESGYQPADPMTYTGEYLRKTYGPPEWTGGRRP